jgi:hypothetical protein
MGEPVSRARRLHPARLAEDDFELDSLAVAEHDRLRLVAGRERKWESR